MAINISQDFKRTSAAPIDATLVLTKAEMLAVDDNLMPDKYFAVCKDDGKFYIYDKSATAGAETGKFSVLEGGGGGGDTYTLPSATATTLGGVKIGDGVTVAADGTISVDAGGGNQDLESVLTTGYVTKNKLIAMRGAKGDLTQPYTNISSTQINHNNPTTGNSTSISGSQVYLSKDGECRSYITPQGVRITNVADNPIFTFNAYTNTCAITDNRLKTAIKTALGVDSYTAGDGIDITNNELSVTVASDDDINTMLTDIFGA